MNLSGQIQQMLFDARRGVTSAVTQPEQRGLSSSQWRLFCFLLDSVEFHNRKRSQLSDKRLMPPPHRPAVLNTSQHNYPSVSSWDRLLKMASLKSIWGVFLSFWINQPWPCNEWKMYTYSTVFSLWRELWSLAHAQIRNVSLCRGEGLSGNRLLVWVNYTTGVPKMRSFVAKSVPERGQENRHASVGANPNEPSHPLRLVCVC